MKNKKRGIFLLGLCFVIFSQWSFGEELPAQGQIEKQIQAPSQVSEDARWIEYFGDHDPWERWNRRIYYFNYEFDRYIFNPITRTYRAVTPDFVEHRVTNFYKNGKNVSILGNTLLQSKGRKAMRTLARMSINTILGLGGLFDVASELGMPKPYEDFGLTLAYYGVPRGPYVLLPILGPSYLRDTLGLVVDMQFTKGLDFYPDNLYVTSLSMIDQKARSSFSFYGTNSPFEYDYVRFLHKKYRTIQEETHQKLNIGGI